MFVRAISNQENKKCDDQAIQAETITWFETADYQRQTQIADD